MNYILFDEQSNRDNLKPLSFTRPLGELRVGILTVREKWEQRLNAKTSTLTEDYLQAKFPLAIEEDNLLINASVLPTVALVEQVANLNIGQQLVSNNVVVATRVRSLDEDEFETVNANEEVDLIEFCWDIFSKNGKEIQADYGFLTAGRKSQPISNTNKVSLFIII